MSAFVNNYIDFMLNWIAGTGTAPNTLPMYVSVWTGDPQGAGVECTANLSGSTTRPTITFGNVASGSQVATSNALVTITASASHANTVDHIGLNANNNTANTSSLIGSATVTTKNLNVGDSLTIPVNNCSITLVGYSVGTFSNTNATNVLLNWLVGNANTPAATTGRYLGLWNGDPQASGTEVTQNLTNSTTRSTITFGNVTANQTAFSNIIVNAVTSATNGNTVSYIALHSNSLTTNTSSILTSVAVTSKTLTVGDALSFPVNNVNITIS